MLLIYLQYQQKKMNYIWPGRKHPEGNTHRTVVVRAVMDNIFRIDYYDFVFSTALFVSLSLACLKFY